MKKCKSCQEEIDDKAKKCPHCQTDQRNWFLRHPLIAVILVIFVIDIVSASSGGKKTNISENNSQSNPVSTTEPSPSPMKITARELADDFDDNQVAAEDKWADKLVEFSAEITNITDSGLSFSKVATKDFSMTQISCRIEDKQQLLPLKNGQTVTVSGVVGTQTIGVIDVNRCVVVE